MKKTAFLFPGQGSQSVGMGSDLYAASDVAREVFHAAEAATGMDIRHLCFQGPMASLTETVNLQPSVTAVNLAFYSALADRGARPDITAGHSLGEYSALYAAGAVCLADTFSLVLRRGELMHREATRCKGAMRAVVGLDIQRVSALVAEGSRTGTVAVANHNTETQIVITGEPDAVAAVSDLAVAAGGRAIPLKVSGAWHSELIRGSVEDFKHSLEAVDFRAPGIPLIMNVTADFAADPNRIKTLMADQLCRPVRWHETVGRLMAEKVTDFVEIGPGRVLTGLLKKTLPPDYPHTLHTVNSIPSMEAYLESL